MHRRIRDKTNFVLLWIWFEDVVGEIINVKPHVFRRRDAISLLSDNLRVTI